MPKQHWKKLGLIFCPDGQSAWAKSHAALPVAVPLNEERYRVFITCRDAKGRSNIGHFELTFSDDNLAVGQLSSTPIISPGAPGCFDDRGAMTSWVAGQPDNQLHYYTGWNLGVTVPFHLNLGLALSANGGLTAERFSEGPILARSSVDPILVASCCVLSVGGAWKMWYMSGTRWVVEGTVPKHYYHLRYAESTDGVHWRATGKVCIDFKDPDEYAISRPSVLIDKGIYRMWFAHRGQSYRIGYAESEDGILWNRRDEDVQVDVSSSGWDSEMMEYPFVFRKGEQLYMLYNGNGYGQTGVGLAVLQD